MDGWVRVAGGLFRSACKQSGWQTFRVADGFPPFFWDPGPGLKSKRGVKEREEEDQMGDLDPGIEA